MESVDEGPTPVICTGGIVARLGEVRAIRRFGVTLPSGSAFTAVASKRSP